MQALEVIEKALKKGSTPFTLGDIATRTGIAIEASRDALDQLLRRYQCRVQVTDRAEIVYDFGPKLRRLGALTTGERLRRLMRWLAGVGRVLFKIWITAMLVGYFALFVLVVVALSILSLAAMASGRGGSGRSSRDRTFRLDGLFRMLASVFHWGTHTRRTRRRLDGRGYEYRRYEPRPAPHKPEKKSFVASVHDFVLGPEPVPYDPLANAREAAAFLRKERGVVVSSDLQALAGWTAEEADAFLAECIGRFEGELKVSERGVLYGRFDRILKTDSDPGADEDLIELYWNEYEPEYEVTGNEKGRDRAVAALNGANLGFAALVLTGVLPTWAAGVLGASSAIATSALVTIAGGWIPLLFSGLSLGLPLVRWFRVRTKNRRREARNLHKRLVRVIFRAFKDEGAELSVEEVLAEANRDTPEEPLTAAQVEPVMRQLVTELRGDSRSDDAFNPRYAFPLLGREQEEARALRAGRELDGGLGNVVIDSQEDGQSTEIE